MLTVSSCGMFKRTKTADKQNLEVVSKRDSIETTKAISTGEVKEQVVDKGTIVTEKETTTVTTKPSSNTKLQVKKNELKPGLNILRDSMGREVRAVLDTLNNILTLDISTPPETETKVEKETRTEQKDQTTDKQEKKQEQVEKQVAVAREDRKKEKVSSSTKTSVPSVTGTLGMWLGIGFAILIVVVGIIWYLRKSIGK